MAAKIKVLVVDDSLITVQTITRILEADPMIEVVGRAMDGEKALAQVEALSPDVVTMDINMPRVDGIQATRNIVRRFGTPIVILSAYASANNVAIQTLQALMQGAIESVQKPSGEIGLDLDMVGAELVAKVKAASRARPAARGLTAPPPSASPRVSETQASWMTLTPPKLSMVGLGVSTGGPSTMEKFVPQIPADYPVPLVLVIHMPGVFIPMLAEKLDDASRIRVSVARDGQRTEPGHLYIGPGGGHLQVRTGGRLALVDGAPVNGCVPSVDVLFSSMAASLGGAAAGIVLTGMGRDGATGLMAIREKGGVTAAQDEKTSVIYGMPRAALQAGAAAYEVPLHQMVRFLQKVAGR